MSQPRPERPWRGVVEWSKGSRERFIWQAGRVVPYRHEPLPAPVNYGCLPDVWNPADDAEADAVWLGQARAVGEEVWAAPSGLLWLLDGDHKVVFGDVTSEKETARKWSAGAQALLNWFPPERGAKLLSATEAQTWLLNLPTAPDK